MGIFPEPRKAYEALGELPEFPGDWTRIDRVRVPEAMFEDGANVADWFHAVEPRIAAQAAALRRAGSGRT